MSDSLAETPKCDECGRIIGIHCLKLTRGWLNLCGDCIKEYNDAITQELRSWTVYHCESHEHAEAIVREMGSMEGENNKLKDRWVKLKEFLRAQQDVSGTECLCYDYIENKMLELEE